MSQPEVKPVTPQKKSNIFAQATSADAMIGLVFVYLTLLTQADGSCVILKGPAFSKDISANRQKILQQKI